MILCSTHSSLTCPSHDAAETLSPGLASGLNSYFFSKSIGSVIEPRAMNRPSIFSRSFDLFADLQSAGRVENLHVGIVAHDLDDLGHHLGIPAVNVTDFVLADRAVRLHDHDVRDDTVYSSCCFHYLFYCLLIKSLPSRLVIRRCSISRPCLSSKRVQRATMFTFTR